MTDTANRLSSINMPAVGPVGSGRPGVADIQINGRDALLSALSTAKGGETFVLAAGNYGDISFYNKAFGSNVTIKSANDANPAHFDTLSINGSSNITLHGIDIGRALAAGEPNYTSLGRISDSQNITLDGVKVHGSLDGDASNDGVGLSINYSTGVTVKNSEFTQNGNGMIFDHSSNILVQNNNIHGMRSDGMDFSSSSQVRIDGNTFRDFMPADGDHSDAMQFWNRNGTTSSRDITIVNNIVLAGDGHGPQGVFIADNNGYVYQNVLIQNNLIFTGGQYNGIMVSGADGVNILGNTVLSPGNDDKIAWIRTDDVLHAIVQDNVTDKIINEGANTATLIHNLVLNGDSTAQAQIPNLLAGLNTVIADLITSGYGYHPIPNAPVYHNVGGALGSQLAEVFVANHLSPSGGKSNLAVTNDIDRIAPTYSAATIALADMDQLLSEAGLSKTSTATRSAAVAENPYAGVDASPHDAAINLVLTAHTHSVA